MAAQNLPHRHTGLCRSLLSLCSLLRRWAQPVSQKDAAVFNAPLTGAESYLCTFLIVDCCLVVVVVAGLPETVVTAHKDELLCTRWISDTQRRCTQLYLLSVQRLHGGNQGRHGGCHSGWVFAPVLGTIYTLSFLLLWTIMFIFYSMFSCSYHIIRFQANRLLNLRKFVPSTPVVQAARLLIYSFTTLPRQMAAIFMLIDSASCSATDLLFSFLSFSLKKHANSFR